MTRVSEGAVAPNMAAQVSIRMPIPNAVSIDTPKVCGHACGHLRGHLAKHETDVERDGKGMALMGYAGRRAGGRILPSFVARA